MEPTKMRNEDEEAQNPLLDRVLGTGKYLQSGWKRIRTSYYDNEEKIVEGPKEFVVGYIRWATGLVMIVCVAIIILILQALLGSPELFIGIFLCVAVIGLSYAVISIWLRMKEHSRRYRKSVRDAEAFRKDPESFS